MEYTRAEDELRTIWMEVTPMPRKKTGDGFDQKAYMNQYITENIIYRRVNFARASKEDMELLAWLDAQPEGKAQYIKRLIRDDMEARETK